MLKYYNALKENVCCFCADSDDKGKCSLTDKEHCAVQLFLPELVLIAQQENLDDFEKSKRALYEKICSNCRTSASEEYCYLREDANCALDRYFPWILETIKKVDQGLI